MQEANRIIDDALSVQEAGAFAVVVECVPSIVGRAVTEALQIPTIGIGAGAYTSGQVLVYHDLLGILQSPLRKKRLPKFCKQYANVGVDIHNALVSYRDEVHGGLFPDENYSPYKMAPEEERILLEKLESSSSPPLTEEGVHGRSTKKKVVGDLLNNDDSVVIEKLY